MCRDCEHYKKQIIRLRSIIQDMERMADKIIDEKYALLQSFPLVKRSDKE